MGVACSLFPDGAWEWGYVAYKSCSVCHIVVCSSLHLSAKQCLLWKYLFEGYPFCIQQHSPRMLSIDALAARAWKLGFTCQKFLLIIDGWKFAQFARLKPHEKFALYSILSPNEPCISRPLWFSACKCVTKCIAAWLLQECLWHQCSYLFRLVLYTCMHINISVHCHR